MVGWTMCAVVGTYRPKRTSAAEAVLQMLACGTAEAVPLSKTDFFSSL